MIVGIDGNEANVKNRVGIGEYAFELLKQFENFKYQISPVRRCCASEAAGGPARSCYSVAGGNIQFQIYLKNRPLGHMPKESENWQYRIVHPSRFWTQIGLPFDLYTHKPRPHVFFTPTHYAPRFCPIPTVISVMDVSYLHYPELFKKSDLMQLKSWTSYSVKNAKRVLTISRSSKNDIIDQYHVPEEKVVVTYPGVKKISNIKYQISNMDTIKNKYGISGEYILFVGTLQPRKNITRLIEAFARIKGNNLELIIVGKKGWLYEDILQAPQKYNIADKVKFLEFVSSEDLPMFYQHAQCFVLPSLYEGFGLPVLEAMQYGCPVIISNISSLPEAGGDAALYIDPENVEDIAEKIVQLIGNQKLRKDLIEKGYQQVKKFSWEKTAKETLKVLEEVVQNS